MPSYGFNQRKCMSYCAGCVRGFRWYQPIHSFHHSNMPNDEETPSDG